MEKYKVGYLAGVFDLFHIGHLNLSKRAKERCDYLIVGALTDELVLKFKNNLPYIPFDERKQILEAIRYVDRVVAVTEKNHEKMNAWNMYHFDCLFLVTTILEIPTGSKIRSPYRLSPPT